MSDWDECASDEQKTVMRRVQLGIEAEAFKRTPLGRYLQDRADHERDALIVKLIDADPDDVKTNTDVRNALHVVDMIEDWIDEVLSSAVAAQQQLNEMEASESPD